MRDAMIALIAVTVAVAAGGAVVIVVLLGVRSVMCRVGDRRG